MAQYGTPNEAFAGVKYGNPHYFESPVAMTDIAYGAPAFGVSGTANVAYAFDSTETRPFLGVTAFRENGGKDFGATNASYQAKDSVDVCYFGAVYVTADDATANAPAYIDVTSGNFTATASSNIETGCFFKTGLTNGVAVVMVNGMQAYSVSA